MRRLVLLLALTAAPACHLGPYYDVHEFTSGPDVFALDRAAGARVKPDSTTAAELLAMLGPPQRVERHGARTIFTWRRIASDQENFGVGIGALTMNVQFLDVEYRDQPLQSITAIVEHDVVVAWGETINGPSAGAD